MNVSLPESRRAAILARVTRDGEVRVANLAADLGVAAITVRRDLALLAEKDLIQQVRGGARSRPSSPLAKSPDADEPTLAIVTPSLHYYWPTVVNGARRAVGERGARLLVQASSTGADDNLALLEEIASDASIDALLFAPDLSEGSASERLVQRLQEMDLPVVLLERSLRAIGDSGRTFDSVRTDHISGAAIAVRHLRDLGHERIALLCDPFSPTRPLLEEGFARATTAMGISELSSHVTTIDTHGPSVFGAVDAFLETCQEEGTTAVVIHSDEAALLALQHARRRGWSIPEDISVMAYDDVLAELAHPPLTAVAPPKEIIGERAVSLALHRLASPNTPIERVELIPSLTRRASTCPPTGHTAR